MLHPQCYIDTHNVFFFSDSLKCKVVTVNGRNLILSCFPSPQTVPRILMCIILRKVPRVPRWHCCVKWRSAHVSHALIAVTTNGMYCQESLSFLGMSPSDRWRRGTSLCSEQQSHSESIPHTVEGKWNWLELESFKTGVRQSALSTTIVQDRLVRHSFE